MKPEDFAAWRARMGYNRTVAAAALGLSRNQPQRFEDGLADIPLHVALACTALDHGLPPWHELPRNTGAARRP